MSHANYPRAAGFGRDANRARPGVVDYLWIAEYGSRAQRREALRILQAHAAKGDPDAVAALADYQSRSGTSSHAWLITIPGRAPFVVFCIQGATAAEMRERYPASTSVEVADER